LFVSSGNSEEERMFDGFENPRDLTTIP